MPRKPVSKNTEASAKAGQAQALKELAPLAREINAALEKAGVSEQRAFDLRLTAAQHLADAKARCAKANIAFKDWCSEHVKYSYDEARKLAIVGESPEPAKTLADMRADNARRNKASRARAKATTTERPSSRATADGPVRPQAPPATQAMDIVQSLPEMERRSLVAELARTTGVSANGAADESAEDAIKRYWRRLMPVARARVLEALASDVGAEIKWPAGVLLTDDATSDPFDLGQFDRREKTKARRAKVLREVVNENA